jgi:hypothetical protein
LSGFEKLVLFGLNVAPPLGKLTAFSTGVLLTKQILRPSETD